MPDFSINAAPSRFPALGQDQVYFDNAGGSQTLDTVIDAITEYFSKTNVQLGASYHTGQISTTKYREGYEAAAKYVNASTDEIVIGSSATQLFFNLGSSLKFKEGDEIILSKLDHESNIAPWLFMAERLKLHVKWWVSPKPELKLTAENLKPVLSSKTKFVACTHISNILGTIHDVRSIADAVHEVGALFCVDGVSYAPHRQVDVKEFGVDFYAFSWYKVYGPHLGILYASSSAQCHISPKNHYFKASTTLEDKLGFAGASYEAVQSIPHIVSYLGGSNPKPVFAAIASHESALQKVLLDFLNSRDDVTIYGNTSADGKVRVPTISFTVKGRGSKEVVEEAEKISNFGFRWGHFYSKRLCDEVLELNEEAVIRVSMVHYNTEEEIRGLVEILKKVLP